MQSRVSKMALQIHHTGEAGSGPPHERSFKLGQHVLEEKGPQLSQRPSPGSPNLNSLGLEGGVARGGARGNHGCQPSSPGQAGQGWQLGLCEEKENLCLGYEIKTLMYCSLGWKYSQYIT